MSFMFAVGLAESNVVHLTIHMSLVFAVGLAESNVVHLTTYMSLMFAVGLAESNVVHLTTYMINAHNSKPCFSRNYVVFSEHCRAVFTDVINVTVPGQVVRPLG
ncbi:hypothetical protein RRG08_006219 [Elysia crispata]|uniref:Uncharacterized protein n=1 Tax=Elysia crispata TaxID=231223 RepID=A0AAE0Y8F4_9GAST|nr:hypothetical protein RRG08_006219 [Elysia crispata]